jgi:hypothetical protein
MFFRAPLPSNTVFGTEVVPPMNVEKAVEFLILAEIVSAYLSG